MKTKTSVYACMLSALALVGCGGEPEPPPVAPPPSPPAANSLSAMLAGEAPAPLPPTLDAASSIPAAEVEVPTFEGNSEAERLTWALRAYYDDPNRPAISTFEPLVEKRLIRNVPVAPPGKQYVIDLAKAEVRLEERK